MPQTIRLNILSDLHLSRAGMPLPHTEADIVILAGDIARPERAIDWAMGFDKPVLYVPGNHEFYGGTLDGTIEALRRLTAGTHIRLLHNGQAELHGVRFLGSTLWSDFNLEGRGPARERAIAQALRLTYDYARIKSPSGPQGLLTPQEMEALYARNRAWLAAKLNEAHQGPTVVITHHAPSPRSIHPRFAGSAINTCFVTDNEGLMGADRVALWVHGHTHNSFDYMVGGTRVVCNPRGYVTDDKLENPDFRPGLVVEISKPDAA
ncbi:metallophosphoesterase [Parapusillimonas granuli]|uniref:metallophosphoesterase n=1 Tax=Parapusillimonas granuli TaxID=380911 RepID=UPI0017A3B17C|nr:metallophosphoesterase [Parapusillimonas granuli]MBB5213866.1 putative phosphodiesterase [Parapusillimonas granuli]MEB2398945.1 metallophosphoesterase [Alcaligenaceae bacterium]